MASWEPIETEFIELYREGSAPSDFDLEYEIEYRLYRRGNSIDGVEYQIEFETTTVRYFPDRDAQGEPIAWKELSGDARARIEAAIKSQAAIVSTHDDAQAWLADRGHF